MSAILEEGIGFGGNDAQNPSPSPAKVIETKLNTKTPLTGDDILNAIKSVGSTDEDRAAQEEFARKHPYDTADAWFSRPKDPFTVNLSPPKYVTNLDPVLKELRPEMTTKPKIQEILDDANKNNPDYPAQKSKNFVETKKLLDTCREKMSNYPKYLSYEGSAVLCVMLSLKPDAATAHISNLPLVDQQTIRALVPEKVNKNLDNFTVKFDENKDFQLQFSYRTGPEVGDIDIIKLNMFNTVAHPRTSDIAQDGVNVVPVEDDGDVVKVGGKIFVDKRTIRTILGHPAKESSPKQNVDEEPFQKRQAVAGRNAYEIRADVLQMAIDWTRGEHVSSKYTRPEDVLQLAKQFYTFVENKR